MKITRHPGESEINALIRCMNDFYVAAFFRLRVIADSGRTGWDDPNDTYDYEGRLRAAVDEKRWVDVANIAMFLRNRSE